MFSKICLLALVTPLISALTIDTPTNWTSQGPATITWEYVAGTDPTTWSFELINPTFNNAFAIANNVNGPAQTLSLTIPVVPAGGNYLLQAVALGNISDVFASTASFSIGAVISSSGTSTGSLSRSAGTPTGTSNSTSAFGTTVTGTTIPTTSTFSSSTATATGFNSNSGSSLKFGFTVPRVSAVAVMVLAALAGGAIVAL